MLNNIKISRIAAYVTHCKLRYKQSNIENTIKFLLTSLWYNVVIEKEYEYARKIIYIYIYIYIYVNKKKNIYIYIYIHIYI